MLSFHIAPDLTAFHSFTRPRLFFDRKFCSDFGFLKPVPKNLREQTSTGKRRRRIWRFQYLYPDQSCSYCGRSDVHLTTDHVVPKSDGGARTLTNLVPACRSCNSDKKSLSLLMFLRTKHEVLKRRAR